MPILDTNEQTDPLLAGLTDPQREAVLHDRGPLLILAGPGSGKTRVITRRIARLLQTGVPAWQILAVTFTNKAALEMRSRVERLLVGDDVPARRSETAWRGTGEPASAPADALQRIARGLTVTTFHSLCARLLRRYIDLANSRGVPGIGEEHKPVPGLSGLSGTYSIYDSADQTALMKRAIADLGLSTSNWPTGSVLHHISQAKNRLMDSGDFNAAASDFHGKTIAKIYGAYERALRSANAVDFDDLLMLTVRMLQGRPDILGEARGRWRHLMIDEYQDTNLAQFMLASLIAGPGNTDGSQGAPDPLLSPEAGDILSQRERRGPNICVVGDPDQSIYGWRGADIRNILEFETHYPSAKVIALGENFRSAAPILTAADALITRNTKRKHKPLIPARIAPGTGWAKPEIVLSRDERAEAALVLDWLRARREEGVEWKEMAVVYRINSLSRVMEEALRTGGAPYVIARGTAFYDREEIKDALAYLRVVANEADDVSLARAINKPARGIGGATIERVRALSAERGGPMLAAARAACAQPSLAPDLSPRALKSLGAFVALVDGWTGHGSFMGSPGPREAPLRDLVERVVKESGLEKHYGGDANDDAQGEAKLENLNELISSAAQFEAQHAQERDAALDGWKAAARGAAGESDKPALAEFAAQAPPLLATLRAWLESVSLVADADAIDPANGAVTLMTLHAAKGLEFDSVAIIGLEEGLLPHSRSQASPDELEEERRLAFVGITRAKERLLLTSARYRTVRGLTERTIPSQFLEELSVPGQVIFSDQTASWGDTMDDADARRDASWNTGDSGASSLEGRGAKSGATAWPKPSVPDAEFPIGCKVRHPQFGVGKVQEVSEGLDARARVEFPGIGAKTLVLRYARLVRVS